MLQKEKLEYLTLQFQRIFTLSVTRTSFRELHNAVLDAMEGNEQEAKDFLESLINPDKVNEKTEDLLFRDFLKTYSVPVRVAKEVHERGEVLSMLATDMGIRGDNLLFSTRIRRIDGKEFHFMSDPEGVLHVLEHFLARLNDAGHSDKGKEILEAYMPRLEKIKALLEKF